MELTPHRPRESGRLLKNGPGRPLTAVYGVFALAATARAGLQLATKFSDAPLAYLLSAFAGVVYIAATVALLRDRRRVAWVTIIVELTGVLVVGTLSYSDSSAFPDQTVWSGYGSGYGYVPLVLPVLGLLWLRASGGSGADVDPDPDPAPGAVVPDPGPKNAS